MDQVKIGKFIAALRRKEGLTQEELGARVGISNKTVSRWENGNYMPDLDMMQTLSREFHISLNELLAGQLLDESDFRRVADEHVLHIGRESAFALHEKKQYFIKKWRMEHQALFVLLAVILAATVILPLVFHKPVFLCFFPLFAFAAYGYCNNAMMAYVEKALYRD